MSLEPLYDIIHRLEQESNQLGIPSISREDGALLAGLAFSRCTEEPGLLVDAGAGIGFSTAWLVLGSLAVKGKCKVIAIEYDSRLYRSLYTASRQLSRFVPVEAINENALNALSKIEGATLIFVDIEKEQYPEALELVDKALLPGGVAAFHNALFPPPPARFFRMIRDRGWPSIVVPTLAGGMLVARKPGTAKTGSSRPE